MAPNDAVFLSAEEAETVRKNKPAPPVITPTPENLDDAAYNYLEEGDRVGREVIKEFKQHYDDPEYTQGWEVIPAPRLIKIWKDYARWGVVHDVRGIEDIVEMILHNIHKIETNSILMGHTEQSPHEYANDLKNEEFAPEYFDTDTRFFDDGKGQWRLSDSMIEKLGTYGMQLHRAKSPEEKLIIIDMVLNVVHPRSDIAAWFVEGGSETLSHLAS